VLTVFSDGTPKCHREVVDAVGLSESTVWTVLYRLWKEGTLLRTIIPVYEYFRQRKGRRGVTRNTRGYYLYILKPPDVEQLWFDDHEFYSYARKHLDQRGGKQSKSKRILAFLKSHPEESFFSSEVAEALRDHG
jgi:hypothetical protein